MYAVSDLVETGCFSNYTKGGTLAITINFKKPNKYFHEVIDIIDYLDHSTITDDKEMISHSERYFYIEDHRLLEKNKNRGNCEFLEIVANILFHLLNKNKKISKLKYSVTVRLEKEILTLSKKDSKNILIDYSIKDS